MDARAHQNQNGATKMNKETNRHTNLGDCMHPTAWTTIPDKTPTTLDNKKGTFPKERKKV